MSSKLLIQGDSLPLPRQTVPYDATWPAQLRRDRRIDEVINRSQSAKTTEALHADNVRFPNRTLESYDPDTVVVQLGIVDCAPRLLSKTEKELLTACPFERLGTVGGKLLKHLRSRSRSRTYVSEAAFGANLQHFLERTQGTDVEHVVVIKILTAGEKYLAKNPDVQAAISAYNERIETVAAEFDHVRTLRPLGDTAAEESEMVDDYTLADGYHLDSDGHRRVYERLSETVPLDGPTEQSRPTVD